jgi:hypothetical protein
MLRRVALVRTEVLEEHSASFIKVTRIGELGTTLAVTINRYTLRRNAKKYHVAWSCSWFQTLYYRPAGRRFDYRLRHSNAQFN